MASNWSALEIGNILNPLQPVTTAIQTLTTNITKALQIQVTLLKTIAALASDLLNLEAQAIKTAIGLVEKVLDKYLALDARIHLLVVPIRKQSLFKLETMFSMPQLDDSGVMSSDITDAERQAFQKAVARIAVADQGNEGFGRTVLESLEDLNDPFKPEYDESSAIYAVVLLAGAKNIINILEVLQALQGIFAKGLRGNTMIPDTITRAPQDLNASLVPPGSVLLKWTNPPALQNLADFDGSYLRVDEFAIIRSTSDEAMLATDWNSFFTDQPTALTSEDDDKTDVMTSDHELSKVILQGKFFTARDTYVDTSTDLIKDQDYYYTVAFRYSIAAPAGVDGKTEYVLQDYFRISNVSKIRLRDVVPSKRGGIAPDWISHESVLDMIPSLRVYFDLVKAYLTSLKSTTTGAQTALNSYIKFLEDEIARYQEFQQDLIDRITQLQKLLQIPAGVYVTTISSTSGGNDAFVKELITRLTDTTDTSAPPFFQNGLTAGLVLLAGASDPSSLSEVKSLISLLFGIGENSQTAYEQAVDEIDAALASSEALVFGDEMTPEL